MVLISKPTHDPKLTRWWWRTLREWIYELVDPLWNAFRGENGDEITLTNVTGINVVSASELAVLDGLTSTTSELNKLSGLTAIASELNKADRTATDGTAEVSKNVVLDASKDILGKRYDINRSLLEALASRPCMRLDGENDYIGFSDPNNMDYITISAWIKPAVLSGYQYIVSSGRNTGTPGGYHMFLSGSTLQGGIWKSSDNTMVFSNTLMITVEEWQHVAFTFDGIDLIVYVNGVASTPVTITADKIKSSPYNLTIGCLSYSPPSYFLYNGCILDVCTYNRALSEDEVKALASGAPTAFADIGASQTDLVVNGEDWTGASGSTPPNNWSDTGSGTAAYIIRDNTPVENFGDDKALEFSASSGSKTLYQSVAQIGKRFRISFVYRNQDGSSSSYVALGSSTNKATLQNTGISGDGVLFEQVFIADGEDLMFFVDAGGTLQVDHVQVIQIGCVAQYQPAGITHAQWQDDSGNELHGSASGAVPLNLPSNHVARYIKQGITGDTTLSDAVPAGYRIKSMVVDVTGAGSGMVLNVGTSAGGTEVVNGQDISANGLFDLTVLEHIFSFSSAQSLYVNDDGGTAWSGVSANLFIDTERVK
ncbi:MAG: LamG domain-containing protein [Fidelibacterota bacterium]|nr:MAG: LamG domain-containing protein [Candidatus Neomarinimicrobiota bacterium]